MLTSSLKSGQRSKGLQEIEGSLELLECDDIEEAHKDLGILSSHNVGLSLEINGLFLEHATESALGSLHYEDIVSDLELGLSVGDEYVVLVGVQVEVEENLD